MSALAFHGFDQLLQTEGLWQKTKILAFRQMRESVLGISGHENYPRRNPPFAQFGEHARAIHLRHHDIGNDKMDLAALLFDDLQRLDSGSRLQHGVAGRGQCPGGKRPDRLFVLDEQNRSMPCEIGGMCRNRLCAMRLRDFFGHTTRQKDRKNCPYAYRARTENIASGLLDDAINGCKAETGTLANILGGKKRLKYLVFGFGRNPVSEVLDLDRHIIIRNKRRLIESAAVLGHDIARAQDDLAALRHRIARVDDQIDENL